MTIELPGAKRISGMSGLPLNFDGLLVIVGGGPVEPETLRQIRGRGIGVVAADGGAQWCARARIVPEAIIGDMDSLRDRRGWAGKTRLVELDEQDTTDFEKCLYATDSPAVLGLGMTGGRLDHTLEALNVMARYGGRRRIILVDGGDVTVCVRGEFSFAMKRGGRVSIFPLAPIRFFRSHGLAFGLEGVGLAPGRKSSISNRADGGMFEIVPEAGDAEVPYLVIMDRENLLRVLGLE